GKRRKPPEGDLAKFAAFQILLMRGKPSEAGIASFGKSALRRIEESASIADPVPNAGKEKAAWGGGFFM
ncbi:hypothetical protein, partial [Paraburkholderia sp. SIMBA_053]|uniref:hypothetical protein n=1 Tax=Paraburkholderia sp. SIMBA_053 TaxID=3085794 RepID=UPI00397DE851